MVDLRPIILRLFPTKTARAPFSDAQPPFLTACFFNVSPSSPAYHEGHLPHVWITVSSFHSHKISAPFQHYSPGTKMISTFIQFVFLAASDSALVICGRLQLFWVLHSITCPIYCLPWQLRVAIHTIRLQSWNKTNKSLAIQSSRPHNFSQNRP